VGWPQLSTAHARLAHPSPASRDAFPEKTTDGEIIERMQAALERVQAEIGAAEARLRSGTAGVVAAWSGLGVTAAQQTLLLESLVRASMCSSLPLSTSSPLHRTATPQIANRNVRGSGWEVAHAAVSRRPLISLDTMVARTEGFTHAANVWDVSIVTWIEGALLSDAVLEADH
jgi:hypothetical protein